MELNALLRAGLREVAGTAHQTLGALAGYLDDPPPIFSKWLGKAFPNRAGFFTGELAARVRAIADLRNPAAHRTPVSLAAASALREETLGVGQEGLIVRLARLGEARRG